MVEAMTGLPGSGKTLRAVNYLWKLKRKGRTVKANIPLIDRRTRVTRQYWFFGQKFLSLTNPATFGQQWSDGFIREPTELLEEDNCTYLIDEAHIWFDARDWATIDREFTVAFSQHRHAGIDIVWTSQSFGRVLKDLRDLTAFQWKCQKWGKWSVAECWDPVENKRYDKRVQWIRPDVYLLYDTTFKVRKRCSEEAQDHTNERYLKMEAERLSGARFIVPDDPGDPYLKVLHNGRRFRRWVSGDGSVYYREETEEATGGLSDIPARWQLDVV